MPELRIEGTVGYHWWGWTCVVSLHEQGVHLNAPGNLFSLPDEVMANSTNLWILYYRVDGFLKAICTCRICGAKYSSLLVSTECCIQRKLQRSSHVQTERRSVKKPLEQLPLNQYDHPSDKWCFMHNRAISSCGHQWCTSIFRSSGLPAA